MPGDGNIRCLAVAFADFPTMAKARPGPAALVLVGGSAGAHEALKPLLASFGASDPVAILITIHIPPVGAGALEDVLKRWTPLRVVTVREPQQPIAAGHVYVASPDNHLVVTPRGVAPSRGAREHHSRPAIDVMFRSGYWTLSRRSSWRERTTWANAYAAC